MRFDKFEGILCWTPRVAAILFILFLSMFAIDVFFEGYNLLGLATASFMHLIPSFLLIIALVIAWKNECAGGIIFILLGLISVIFFNTYRDVVAFLIVSFPLIVIGMLFILCKKLTHRDKNNHNNKCFT